VKRWHGNVYLGTVRLRVLGVGNPSAYPLWMIWVSRTHRTNLTHDLTGCLTTRTGVCYCPLPAAPHLTISPFPLDRRQAELSSLPLSTPSYSSGCVGPRTTKDAYARLLVCSSSHAERSSPSIRSSAAPMRLLMRRTDGGETQRERVVLGSQAQRTKGVPVVEHHTINSTHTW
jgi:hypothetical protein